MELVPDIHVFPHFVSGFERGMLGFAIVRLCLAATFFLRSLVRLISDSFHVFPQLREELAGVCLFRSLPCSVRGCESWEIRLSPKEDEVRRHSRPGGWIGVVRPFRKWEVIDPTCTILDQTLLKLLDERPVLPFHVTLRLRPVWYTRALFNSDSTAGLLQSLRDELSAIVACQQLWRTKRTDEVLECPNNTFRRLVSQLVALDEA